MALDVLFLFTDSDRPDDELAAKVSAGRDRWIWWQGQVVLSGEPEGLAPPPEPEPPPAVRPEHRGLADSTRKRIEEAVARSRQRQAPAASDSTGGREGSAAPPDTATAESVPPVAVEPSPTGEGGTPDRGTGRRAVEGYARSMRAILARRPGPEWATPSWVGERVRAPGISMAQVDSLVAVVVRTLTRIQRQRISSRTDYLVVDMARGAGTSRGAAREFLKELLRQYLAEVDRAGSGEAQRLEAAASDADVAPAAAAAMVRGLCLGALSLYERMGVTTTRELIEQGGRAAGLSAAEAQSLLDCLLLSTGR
jgi:hypothetical protein